MKKVKRRATAALLIAALLFIGVSVYLVRLADSGGTWATYFSASAPVAEITDRNGTVLYTSDGSGYSFAEDWATRVACFQLVGDAAGNVGTGVLAAFRGGLSGYNFFTGTSSGKALKLTVDASLNTTAYAALNGKNGAVMVMNYKTGEVLCMVSTPSMDPQNPDAVPADGTYLNKCLSAAFVPGSVFKLVTLAAAIENIDDLYTRQFWCGGSVEVDGTTLGCTAAHGWQTIEQALADSCNCAFSEIAQELGADTLAEYAEKLGLTTAHEFSGITTAAGAFDNSETGSVELSWSGIGQYHDLVNPYAMLRLVAAIANGGELVEPTLTGHGLFAGKQRLLSADTAQKIADMMDYNVQYAYGTWNFPGLSICAKTGTAEVGDGTSHSWFTGFLDDDDHPYAFVVVIEHGGAGLSHAGSVANTVLQKAVSDDNG